MSKIVSIAIECRNETTTHHKNLYDDDNGNNSTNKCIKIMNKNKCGNDRQQRRALLLRLVITTNLRSLLRLEQIKA